MSMMSTELLRKYNFTESLLGEIRFTGNCDVVEITIQPGVFIAPDVLDPGNLVLSFENCLFFEMKRLNVAEFEEDQLFLIHEGARTITAVVEDRSMIPLPWREKYGSKTNSIVVETVD